MKHIMYILLFNLFSLSAFCQVVAIQNDEDNIVFLGWNNHITIAVEGQKAKSIFVATDNGKIEESEFKGPGHYTFWPRKVGLAKIYVKKIGKNGNWKIIDSSTFRVKRLPLPKAKLWGRSGGEITQSMLLAQIALHAPVEEFDGNYAITRFTVVVNRHKREIFMRTMASSGGARIDSITNNFFYRLKNNDKLVFKDIVIKDFDGTERDLEPIEFTIIDAHKYHRKKVNDRVTVIDPITGQESIKIMHYKYKRVR